MADFLLTATNETLEREYSAEYTKLNAAQRREFYDALPYGETLRVKRLTTRANGKSPARGNCNRSSN